MDILELFDNAIKANIDAADEQRRATIAIYAKAIRRRQNAGPQDGKALIELAQRLHLHPNQVRADARAVAEHDALPDNDPRRGELRATHPLAFPSEVNQ